MTEQVERQILDKYTLIKKVGSGAYGHVWKVSHKANGQTYALKKIFDAFQHSTDAQRTFRQIVFLQELNHPNIIKLHNVMKADNHQDLYLVFQFMEADLHNAIGQKVLKDIHHRFILYQIVKAIKFIHSAQLIHRDLKPSNILLNNQCNVKICDFGLARSLLADKCGETVVMTEEVATRWYRAPQILLGSQKYDTSADIWSIGCILGQLLLGKALFPGNSTLDQLQKIISFTSYPSKEDVISLGSQLAHSMMSSLGQLRIKPIKDWFPHDTAPQAIDLLTKMLQFSPQKRPKCQQILSHPYLQKFHNKAEQKNCNKTIYPPVSDNKKLNLKQYRQLIYERISRLYGEQYSQSIHQQPTKKRIQSPKQQKTQQQFLNKDAKKLIYNTCHSNLNIKKSSSQHTSLHHPHYMNVSNQKQNGNTKSSLKGILQTRKYSTQQPQQKSYIPYQNNQPQTVSSKFFSQTTHMVQKQPLVINQNFYKTGQKNKIIATNMSNMGVHSGKGVKINNRAAIYKQNKLGRNASAINFNTRQI